MRKKKENENSKEQTGGAGRGYDRRTSMGSAALASGNPSATAPSNRTPAEYTHSLPLPVRWFGGQPTAVCPFLGGHCSPHQSRQMGSKVLVHLMRSSPREAIRKLRKQTIPFLIGTLCRFMCLSLYLGCNFNTQVMKWTSVLAWRSTQARHTVRCFLKTYCPIALISAAHRIPSSR